MKPETWDNEHTRCFGMLLDGRAQTTGIKRRGSDATLLIVFNAHHDVVKFRLPLYYEAYGWTQLIDTNAPVSPARKFRGGDAYKATGRSLLMFERVPILAATTGGAGAADLPASRVHMLRKNGRPEPAQA